MDKTELWQKRISNISVSSSTVRGQPKLTVQSIRDFLIELDLSQFENIDEQDSFGKILDELTYKLMNRMPSGKFGFARKCLNIFLLEITHNTILVGKYKLDKLIPFLEVPIDNPNEKELRKQAKEVNWQWKSIKDLQSEDNRKIQVFTKDFMLDTHHLERVYFDLINWRK